MRYNEKAAVSMLTGGASTFFAVLTISTIAQGDAIGSAFSAVACVVLFLIGLGEVQGGK